MSAIDAEIEAIKSQRAQVQSKIDATLGNKRDLNKLKNRKVRRFCYHIYVKYVGICQMCT